MKLKDIDIGAMLAQLRQQLDDGKELSPVLRSTIEMLLVIVTLLVNRLGLNSRNSSTPPSSDPNRKRK